MDTLPFRAFFIAQWGRGPDWYSIYRAEIDEARWFLVTVTRREGDGISRIGQLALQRMQAYTGHTKPAVYRVGADTDVGELFAYIAEQVDTGCAVCLACESSELHDAVFGLLNPSKEMAYRATETDHLVKMPMAQALDEVSATVVRVK